MKTKNYLIGGVVLVGAGLYYEYVKISNADITFNHLKINKISNNGDIDLDLFLNIINPSHLKLDIKEQIYTVYANDIKVLSITNLTNQIIKSQETSIVKVNVLFKHMKNSDIINILMTGNVQIKVDVQLKVKILFLPLIKIPYVYETSLLNLLKSK